MGETIERKSDYNTPFNTDNIDEDYMNIAVANINLLCKKYDLQRYEAFEIAKQSYLLRICNTLFRVEASHDNGYFGQNEANHDIVKSLANIEMAITRVYDTLDEKLENDSGNNQ